MAEQPEPATITSASLKVVGVAVVGGVHEPAAEALAPGPVGDVGGVRVPGRDDHVVGALLAVARPDDQLGPVAIDALDLTSWRTSTWLRCA